MTAIRLSVMAMALVMTAGTARAQEGPKPGKEHELLKQMEGNWAGKVKFGEAVGGMEGTAELAAKMEINGLFLVTTNKFKLGEMELHARSITGYDTHKKKFTGTWVDSMSTAIWTMEGSFDKDGKVYSEIMTGPNPMDGSPMKLRIVTEIKNKDAINTKMYFTPPGADKEALLMEIDNTRKK